MAVEESQRVCSNKVVQRSGTFAFAAASPLGLRSAARLLVVAAVDDAGIESEIDGRESQSIGEHTLRHVGRFRDKERARMKMRQTKSKYSSTRYKYEAITGQYVSIERAFRRRSESLPSSF